MTALAQERMMNDCSNVKDALQLLEATPSVAPAFSVPRKQHATGFSHMCRPHQLSGTLTTNWPITQLS